MSSNLAQIIAELREGFSEGVLRSLESRKTALKSLHRLLAENEDAICQALFSDLHRGRIETLTAEVVHVKYEICSILSGMESWLRNESIPINFISLLDNAYIQRQPYGVVLIIMPWNYPFQLSLVPLIGAIAAGNTVLLKASEHAKACAELLINLVPKYLEKKICQVISGDASFTKDLLEEHRFDHIFFTGSCSVGRSVYVAAAKKLTPVTLELGGKCPAYVDSTALLEKAVRRISWAKLSNAGQTCIAPDYVLCHEVIYEEFSRLMCEQFKLEFGEDAKINKEYAHIINTSHLKRLRDVLARSNANVLMGGDSDPTTCYFAPTVLTNVNLDDAIMEDEIFGPILPIVSVKSVDEAVKIINDRPKPLAVYVFTQEKGVFNQFEELTSSGGLVQNDCVTQIVVPGLPFGGVGQSGLGRYHGRFSVETFSHQRAVLLKSTNETFDYRFRYRPYNESTEGWLRWLLKANPEGRSCSMM